MSKAGYSLYKTTDTIKTKIGTPYWNKISDGAYDIGFNNIELSWPEPNSGGHPVIFYKIYKKNSDDSYELLIDKIKTLSYNLLNLESNTHYSFKITAQNELGESNPLFFDNILTSENLPFWNEIIFSPNSAHDKALKWNMPNNSGSKILGYTLTISSNDSEYDISTKNEFLNFSKEILPNKNYNITIIAINKYGKSPKYTKNIFIPKVKPKWLSNLEIINLKNKSMTLFGGIFSVEEMSHYLLKFMKSKIQNISIWIL